MFVMFTKRIFEGNSDHSIKFDPIFSRNICRLSFTYVNTTCKNSMKCFIQKTPYCVLKENELVLVFNVLITYCVRVVHNHNVFWIPYHWRNKIILNYFWVWQYLPLNISKLYSVTLCQVCNVNCTLHRRSTLRFCEQSRHSKMYGI